MKEKELERGRTYEILLPFENILKLLELFHHVLRTSDLDGFSSSLENQVELFRFSQDDLLAVTSKKGDEGSGPGFADGEVELGFHLGGSAKRRRRGGNFSGDSRRDGSKKGEEAHRSA